MSNPLILHGAKVPLPRPRPAPFRPMPILTEDPCDPCSPQQVSPPSSQHTATATCASPQPTSALQASSPTQAPPLPARNAQAGQIGAANAATKDRQLSTDQLRLRLRMQGTIEAYSGHPSAAARSRRNNLVTSTLPSALYRRTNSSPVRGPRLLGRTQSESRRATHDCSSSCQSSSTCSSAAPHGDDIGMSPRVEGGVGECGEDSRSAAAHHDRTLLQTKSLSSCRGIPQVAVREGPGDSQSPRDSNTSAIVNSLIGLKASPTLVAAFLRTQPGAQDLDTMPAGSPTVCICACFLLEQYVLGD